MNPLEAILAQAQGALDAGLYFPALFTALTFPDIKRLDFGVNLPPTLPPALEGGRECTSTASEASERYGEFPRFASAPSRRRSRPVSRGRDSKEPAGRGLGAVFGLEIPPFRGGPFRFADAFGPAALASRLESLASKLGPRFEQAALLREKATKGEHFY